MKSEVPEPIYVVGFPKSGNTWLTRLMADVLQSSVSTSDVWGRGSEIASEINRNLSLPASAKLELFKVHFLPTVLLEGFNQMPNRIAYIYRDFRDVAISAFFYWNKLCEADVQTASFSSLLLGGPLELVKYCYNRRRLIRYIQKLCIDGIAEDIGTWSQHIAAWHNVSTQRKDVRIAFVSYEDLLQDTSSTMLRIMRTLRLPEPSDESLQNAVDRQSFAALKQYFQKLPDDAEIPLGRDFNIRFLRKGVSGDWKNFLSPQMGQIIQKYHGEMLFKLGYETDLHWYKKIELSAP